LKNCQKIINVWRTWCKNGNTIQYQIAQPHAYIIPAISHVGLLGYLINVLLSTTTTLNMRVVLVSWKILSDVHWQWSWWRSSSQGCSNTKDTLLSFNHGIRDCSDDAVGVLNPNIFKCSYEETSSPDSIPD